MLRRGTCARCECVVELVAHAEKGSQLKAGLSFLLAQESFAQPQESANT